MNTLYYGDNLDVLRQHVSDESVDLVYLDPPFKSDQNYNVLFAEQDGSRSAAQIKAFSDTWRWDEAAATAYERVVEQGGALAEAMLGLRNFLGDNDLLAYLSMMAPRLYELRRVLKPDGSVFLHCDPTASHYLKIIMDATFGPRQFRNEIIWCYWGPGSPGQRQFSRKHDVIFWYSKSDKWTFNADAVRLPHSAKTLANYKAGLEGSGFIGADRAIHVKGKIPEDWWPIAIAPRSVREYLGYPTQKPEALLERILLAASDVDSVVLDPFCGCGTTLTVAQRLRRRWIGIDITHLAINLIKHRLLTAFTNPPQYEVIGEPVSLPDAFDLAKSDPYQFQWWALGLVGARPVEQKKGADKGVDGRLFFHDEGTGGATKQIIFSVKAGRNVGVAMVRDLGHVVSRENAQIGVLITMAEPTQAMRREVAGSGFYESPWNGQKYPRLQLRTVEELLGGKGVDYPMIGGGDRTFKRAQPRLAKPDQPSLEL